MRKQNRPPDIKQICIKYEANEMAYKQVPNTNMFQIIKVRYGCNTYDSPTQSWNWIGPVVVFALKFGNSSPKFTILRNQVISITKLTKPFEITNFQQTPLPNTMDYIYHRSCIIITFCTTKDGHSIRKMSLSTCAEIVQWPPVKNILRTAFKDRNQRTWHIGYRRP
jgi:hypothetical protein